MGFIDSGDLLEICCIYLFGFMGSMGFRRLIWDFMVFLESGIYLRFMGFCLRDKFGIYWAHLDLWDSWDLWDLFGLLIYWFRGFTWDLWDSVCGIKFGIYWIHLDLWDLWDVFWVYDLPERCTSFISSNFPIGLLKGHEVMNIW